MGIEGSSKLAVNIGRLKLKNPVMVASGTFGYAEEFKGLVHLKDIGAIITKSITLEPYEGNPPPRLWETTAGMLNAIGLQNEGIDDFIKNKLPFLNRIDTAIIVSIAGKTTYEYKELAKILDKTAIDGIEINISCPNIKSRSKLFAQDIQATAEVVRAVRKQTKKTIITKLSPNVTDITEIAMTAEKAGTDAISLINTLVGMAVDIKTKRPQLGNITGGLSGPAIKPIALRMVWEVYNAVKIPVIGIGGIMNRQDAVEFFICGATAIQIGTANFINPNTACEIITGLEDYLRHNRLANIKELTGSLISDRHQLKRYEK
jgi:dihydroorotate dehydrogenase (NAD+) catalytic subunit